MATPTCAVLDSIPRMSTASAFLRPGRHRLTQRARAGAPPGTDGLDLDDAIVVALTELQADFEEVGGQRGCDDVAPLDDRHATVVEQLGQPDVEHLVHLFE